MLLACDKTCKRQNRRRKSRIGEKLKVKEAEEEKEEKEAEEEEEAEK